MKISERGSAVIFILLAIALFAALAFSFIKSGQSGAGNLSAGQAKLAAEDIMGYAQSVERGVQKVMSKNGCSEMQLAFDRVNMYDCDKNDDAPNDNSCAIFDPAGGGITPRSFPSLPDMKFAASGGTSLEEIGPTWDAGNGMVSQDIVLWFGPIDIKTCNALNTLAGNNVSVPPVVNQVQNWCFNDNLSGGTTNNHFGTSTVLSLGSLAGKKAGCVNQSASADLQYHLPRGYSFYYVLMDR